MTNLSNRIINTNGDQLFTLKCKICNKESNWFYKFFTDLRTQNYCEDCKDTIKFKQTQITEKHFLKRGNGNYVTVKYPNQAEIEKVIYLSNKGHYIKLDGKNIYLDLILPE